MKIEWTVKSQQPMTLKSFLKTKRISKRLLAKVKYQGGLIEVNRKESRVRKLVTQGDVVTLILPNEPDSETLNTSHEKISILFEDEHYIILNKPCNVASVPSSLYSNHTMANRVKGYIVRNNYVHKRIHIVTRLDKDTSGVMIFAKHGLAHSYLDQQLQEKRLYKEYTAFVDGVIETPEGIMDEPISRSDDSIIKRRVHHQGKPSLTEYWVKERYLHATRVKIQLHTGRTHQIRVHFAAFNHALLGDMLYNPNADKCLIDRQALHCSKVVFQHPFSDCQLTIEAPLPNDLISLTNQLESMKSE